MSADGDPRESGGRSEVADDLWEATEITGYEDGTTSLREPPPGRRIGPYRLERLIARGGMGAVYLAERQDHFKQRVALKLIHPEKVSEQILRRFHAERQMLASLEHPHIARILDGGTTTSSLPFFVMEYVEGEPLDRACLELPLRQRLKLFQKVCWAVHYAHQKLIVHRDLKPGNILVTADGAPKLLDFGIAELLGSRPGDDGDGDGSPGDRSMTLAYASPEQLAGGPVTTATDIYSLGILLYQVLSGQHPYRFGGVLDRPLARDGGDETTAPPSQKATPEVARRLVGDLDAITAKTLHADPGERYDSAAQVAEEIQRHLDDLPVMAWRGSWFYRARKSARRHKLGFATALLVLSFTVSVTVLWRHAVAQRAEAERALVRAERTKEFIVDFFDSVEPNRNPGTQVDLRAVLEQGRRELTESLHQEPEIRADLLGTLGVVYNALALYDEALELKEEAVRSRREADPRSRRELATDLNNLASTYYGRADYGAAEETFRQALAMWQELGDADEVTVASNLAASLVRQGRVEDALPLYRQALGRAMTHGSDPLKMAGIHYGLGAAYRQMEDFPKAEKHLLQALETYRQHPDSKPSRIAQVQSSLGQVLHARGRALEARPLLEQALESRRRLFGDPHPMVAASETNLADLLLDLGQLEAAEVLLASASGTCYALRDEERLAKVEALERRLAAALPPPPSSAATPTPGVTEKRWGVPQ